MPYVKVKYTLTTDATVAVDVLRFGSKDADKIKKDGTEVFPKKKIFVDDQISVKLEMSGFGGNWVLAVWVSELNASGNASGKWIACAENGTDNFKGDIKEKSIYHNLATIQWS